MKLLWILTRDEYLYSGGGGNRTRVRICADKGCYMFSTVIVPLTPSAHGHAFRVATWL